MQIYTKTNNHGSSKHQPQPSNDINLSRLFGGERFSYVCPVSGGAGFIPVCSGNAPTSPRLSSAVSVYPRVLGERDQIFLFVIVVCGLSPCARGTLRQTPPKNQNVRFIPVCSGNALIQRNLGEGRAFQI